MRRHHKNIVHTLVYVSIVVFLFYNISALQYHISLKHAQNQFNEQYTLIDQNIQEAVLTAKLIDDKLIDTPQTSNAFFRMEDLPTYIEPFKMTYETINSPFLRVSLNDMEKGWIEDLYKSPTEIILTNDATFFEYIVIGHRYGKPNSVNSGIVGIRVHLNDLISETNRENALGEATVIIGSDNGNILYHEDYINNFKPSVNELFPNGSVIPSDDSRINIKKVIYQGKGFLFFDREFTSKQLNVIYIVPWISVFYQWQVFSIFLAFATIFLTLLIYHYVRNEGITKDIKLAMRIQDRYISENSIEALYENMKYKDRIAEYFEFEMLTVTHTLKILEEIDDETLRATRIKLMDYLLKKSELIYAHTNGDINYERAWIQKFEVSEIIFMTVDFMHAIAERRNVELTMNVGNIIEQEIYSYPNDLWITVITLFYHLTEHQKALNVQIKMRGELSFIYKTEGILHYDEDKIKRIQHMVQDRFNASLNRYDNGIYFEWPFIKKNHLPMQKIDRFEEMSISCYKLSYASERILRLIGDQLHFEITPFVVGEQGAEILFVEMERFDDKDIPMLKAYDKVVLLYMSYQHDRWIRAEEINAIATLQLPLSIESIRKLFNSLI